LDSALGELAPELRTVFVLFELEERTMAEIAELLQIPSGTVASRLRRAREQFRDRVRGRVGRKAAAAGLGASGLAAASSAKAAGAGSGGSLLAQLGGAKVLAVVVSAAAIVAAPASYVKSRALANPAVPVATSVLAAATLAPQDALEGTRVAAVTALAAPLIAPKTAIIGGRGASKPASNAGTLPAELAQLDVARSRLASGRAEEALGLLDAYEHRVPHGVLGLEAEVMRIDALSRTGRIGQAEKRAEVFLARHAGSVLAARVRRIVGR
jgi:hypothetical protein